MFREATSLRVLNDVELELVSGGLQESGGETNSTTTPPGPPPDPVPYIDWSVIGNDIVVTASTDISSNASIFTSFTFELPSGGLDRISLGFNESGTSGSFTFDLSSHSLSETFSHDFGGVNASISFSTSDTEDRVTAGVTFHF